MPKPPGGPQTPTHPPPSALNCWLWSVVTVESICFFGVLQDLNYVLPPTRFKPLWAVRFVTKFTSETFNRRVEKQPRYPCGLCDAKLIVNFSHESDVTSLDPFLFYYCVPHKIPRGILLQTKCRYFASPRLSSLCSRSLRHRV